MSSLMLIGSLGIGSLAAGACEDNSAPGGPTNPGSSSVTLAIGQTSTVHDTSLSVTFTGVPSDSRCPSDVICVQLGDAVVALDVATSSGSAKVELHTGNDSHTADVGNYHIELTTLLPYPTSSHPVTPGEYRATLAISNR